MFLGRGGDEEEESGNAPAQDRGGVADDREGVADFLAAASGEKADDGSSARSQRLEVFFARGGVHDGRRHVVEHGMADVAAVHAERVIERFLERQDGHHARHEARDAVDAARHPCPDLRADVVADGDFSRARVAGQPKVEAGIVHGHEDVGRLAVEFADAVAEDADPSLRVAEGAQEAHAGMADGVGDDPDAGGGHPRAADAGEADVRRESAQRLRQRRAEPVAGMLAGGDEYAGIGDHR